MMKLHRFGLLLCTLLALLLISESSKEPTIIYWSDGYKLSWEDFEGHPRYDYDKIAALTSSGIVDYKGCKDGKIIYKVQAYFEKDKSWFKEEAHNEYHLAHEQLHFDITELYARRLRLLLDRQNFQCGQEVAFEKFVHSNLENWYTEQKNYDIQTRHSMDKIKQKEWYYRIKMELSLLSNYQE